MYSCLSLCAAPRMDWQLVHGLVGWAVTPESMSALEAVMKK